VRPTLAALAVLAASLALVATGCGGDDSSEGNATAEWAEGFCTAVSAWSDEVERLGDEVGDPSSLSADEIEQAVDDLATATETFVDDVRALGAPDTASGQEVEDSLDALADTLEEERNDIREAVDGVSGLGDVATAISAIGTSLTAMADAFGDALQALEDADVDGELERALEDTPECDQITD
jgi:hypothetical protein